MCVHQRRPFALAHVLGRPEHHVVGSHGIAAVHLLDQQAGEVADEPRDGPARRLNLDRHRDRVAVVLNEEEDGELQIAGGVERLPELSLTGRAVARRNVHELVALDGLVGDAGVAIVAEPRFCAAHGLKELRPRGARLAHDVERTMAPVRWHLPAARVGILGGADRREEHLRRGHAETETERAIAIVGIEPVVGGAEGFARSHQDSFVPGARDLEEDLVLALELDFLVVDASRQEHQPIHLEQIGLREGFGGPKAGLGARRH